MKDRMATRMVTFGYNFGGFRDIDEIGEENVKDSIRQYFDGRDNMEIVEFVGNTTPPPGDIMRVLVEAPRSTGYDVMQDSDAKNLSHGVSIIQGGVDT